jgi:hypothetical protein
MARQGLWRAGFGLVIAASNASLILAGAVSLPERLAIGRHANPISPLGTIAILCALAAAAAWALERSLRGALSMDQPTPAAPHWVRRIGDGVRLLGVVVLWGMLVVTQLQQIEVDPSPSWWRAQAGHATLLCTLLALDIPALRRRAGAAPRLPALLENSTAVIIGAGLFGATAAWASLRR